MRVIPNERNIHLETNWRYAISKNNIFLVTNRDTIYLVFVHIYILTIRDKYYTWRKCHVS